MDVIEYVKTEMGGPFKCPAAVLLLILGGDVVGWAFANLLYRERLAFAHDRNANYQERLGLVPRDHTAYSKLTDRELKGAPIQSLPTYLEQLALKLPRR